MTQPALDQLALPAHGGARRFLPQLSCNDYVIDFLTQGADYDIPSVERAVHEANLVFDAGEYLKSLEFYAVAYEIFRFLPEGDRYFPLAHDCILRRVICHSIVGDFERGLEECLVALAIIPNTWRFFVMCGCMGTELVGQLGGLGSWSELRSELVAWEEVRTELRETAT